MQSHQPCDVKIVASFAHTCVAVFKIFGLIFILTVFMFFKLCLNIWNTVCCHYPPRH